jgi:hypothetical protein
MFFLVVPEDMMNKARKIVSYLGIEVTLVGYHQGGDGAIIFYGEIVPPM